MKKDKKTVDEKVEQKEETHDLDEKVKELNDQLARALADYQNLERRVHEERVNTIRYANEEFIKKLLPAFDNLFLAEKYTQDQGIKITVQHLLSSLKDVGVEKIDVVGKEFDANTMEAVEVGSGEENVVIEELRPGYVLYEKVIRPSHVKVGKKS